MDNLLKIIIESGASTDEKIAAIKEFMESKDLIGVSPLPLLPELEDYFPSTDPWIWPYDRRLSYGDIFSTTKCQF